MYLKTLKVVGFKSFADRTRLEFRPGVSVVVGPNGSGKSNLVDAIHWVMGSQAPRSLRTGKMEDVIFAGTATRPALNRGEVTVIFDNAQRQLPLDLDEISITRRLYRDGSSDYEINGVGCRLLDIQELLSDSGVGRHQHVIVNQGQVDSILNAGPDEHRAVIEEAAGILKHKLRRERASRRLERTDEDVVRLNDLLGEMARQLRPLRRQAEAASRHHSLAEDVRRLGLFLAGEELRIFDRRLTEAAIEHRELEGQTQRLTEVLDRVGERLRTDTAEAATIGAALDRDTAAAARLETTIERLRRVAQVAQERHRTRQARHLGESERRRDLEQERDALQEEIERALADEISDQKATELAEENFRQLDVEVSSLADQERLGREGAVAVMTGDLRSMAAADQRDQHELESVGRQLEVIEGQIDHEEQEAGRLAEEIRGLDEEVVAAQAAYEQAASSRRRDQEEWEAAESTGNELSLRLAAAQARREAMDAAAAGLAEPGHRQLALAAGGSLGSLTDLLRVPSGLVAAVEACLGDWAGAVAFAGGDDLATAVGVLKGEAAGGVALVRADAGPPVIARRVAQATGLEALIDLLGADAHQGLAAQLLGDVVVVEGWLGGWQLVQRHPQVRAVTPEGDLIASHGVRVAHPDGVGPAMVEAAQLEVERAEREVARAESRQHVTRRQFEQSRKAERTQLEALEALEARLAGTVEAKGRADRALIELQASRERLSSRRSDLERGIEAREEQRQRLHEALAAWEGAEAEQHRLAAERAAQREALSRQRDEALTSWQDWAAQASSSRSRRALLQDRLQVVGNELAREGGPPVSETSLQRLADIEGLARQAIDILKAKLDDLRDRQQAERASTRVLGERLAALRREHEATSHRLTALRERISTLAVEEAEARARREGTAEALRLQFDASEEEALAQLRPEGPEDEDLRAVLATRQAELRRLGPVNPLAEEEYRSLAERHDFLASQLADLENSRNELRKVIRALDEEIEEQFLAAFAEVAAAYEQQFALLFPGGKGRIRLAEPESPLTSGVEIEAQPLGKKIGRLSLLSGGERSLAALAFLFAIFKARPSPFYVLDEVEAALDDSNLRRFLRLVEAFREESQLIIVTHQQQTMEAADVLYGVTMEPGGSSIVVAKALSEVSSG